VCAWDDLLVVSLFIWSRGRAGVVAERAEQRGRHRLRADGLDAAQTHAQVLALDHHAHATRQQVGVEPVGHLLCEAFLYLGAASEKLDHPGPIGQGEDAIAGQVADVHDADEWPRRCRTW
jgi:hypothetical protein